VFSYKLRDVLNLPLDDLPAPIRIKFRVLAVPQIHHELLLGPRVETKVSLVGEIIAMEHDLHEGRLRHESLRLLALPAEDSGLFPVRHVRLGVAVHDLEQDIHLI
jgi:hypothetical protein